MKTAEEYFNFFALDLSADFKNDTMTYEGFKSAITERDQEWKNKIKEVLSKVTNFHCQDVLKELLEDE